jgi:hypothetical protein
LPGRRRRRPCRGGTSCSDGNLGHHGFGEHQHLGLQIEGHRGNTT